MSVFPPISRIRKPAIERKRYSTERVFSALKQTDMGLRVADLTCQMGITQQSYYTWKKTFSGLGSE